MFYSVSSICSCIGPMNKLLCVYEQNKIVCVPASETVPLDRLCPVRPRKVMSCPTYKVRIKL